VFKAAGRGHPPAPPSASAEINLTFDDSGELGLWFGCADLCGPKTVTRVKLGSQAAQMPQLQPFFVATTGQCIPNGRLELVAVSGAFPSFARPFWLRFPYVTPVLVTKYRG
jgi:hypothetical protein